MLQAAHKFTFKCAVLVRMSPVPMLPPINPISYVAIPIRRLPNSVSVFSTLLPFSLEQLAVQPLISSFAFSKAILEVSEVFSINILFTSSDFLIIFKQALKYGSLCHQNTLSIFNPQLRNPEVDPILIRYYLKVFLFDDLLQVEGGIHWSVVLDETFILLSSRNMKFITVDAHIRTCLLIVMKSLAKLCLQTGSSDLHIFFMGRSLICLDSLFDIGLFSIFGGQVSPTCRGYDFTLV